MVFSILIIDDDDSFRETLKMFLKSENFEVYEASNGDQAIKLFSENKIDLYIVDVLLPRKNGFKVIEEIKSNHGLKTPFIMVSGFYKGFKHKQDAMSNFGALDYLEKPLQLEGELKPLLIKTFPTHYSGDSSSAEESTMVDDMFEDPLDFESLDERTLTVDVDDIQEIPDFTPFSKNDKIEGYNEAKEVESAYSESAKYVKESNDFFSGEITGGDNNFWKAFPELLINYYKEEVRGELRIHDLDSDVKKRIFFDRGIPIYITSTLVSECLGNILVSERIITSSDRDKSLKIMKDTRKPQGKVLREMNCLSLENLKYGLIKQLETKLYDIFSWRNFRYRFKPLAGKKLPVPPKIYTIESSFPFIIYNGVMDGYDIEVLKPFFKQFAKKTIVHTDSSMFQFDDDELFDDEIIFYKSLRRGKTLMDIVRENSSEKENVLKQVIIYYVLDMIDFL